MKKLIVAITMAVFLAALVPMNSTAFASSSKYGPVTGMSHQTSTSSKPPLELNGDQVGIDGSPFFIYAIAEGAQPDTGNTWTVPVLDEYMGGFYYLDFERVASGVHCNVWVGLSPDVWTDGFHDYYVDKGTIGTYDNGDEWHFAYAWSYDGSLAGFTGTYEDVIYYENITYLIGQFDNNIWQKDTYTFGMYKDRPGPLGDWKIQILIFNIRDGMFYDPATYTSFIEGYFWSFASELNDANIFHMDTYQWYRRLGPNPQPDPRGYAPRPYEYEGTFAHEFQHLIHYDVDSDELSWVNEGCSQLAVFVCGYGISMASDIYYYLAYFWDTSLVVWYNNLENYGVVYLWTLYMYEHYGGRPFIWDLVHEQANGIQGYNNVLKAHHIRKNFDEIFQDWEIATYLDDTSFAHGIYGYYNLVIPSARDTLGWSIPLRMAHWQLRYPWLFQWIVNSYPNSGYNYPFGDSLPYQANYVIFNDGAPALKVKFNGDDYTGIAPHSPTNEWHSDGIAYSWFRLGQGFSIPTTGATLKFWTFYDIEEDWDYGYVEVHDLSTDQWYTLPGLTTVTTLKNPEDNPNCPDEFEPTTYYAAHEWNAFTGSSGDWYQEQMDLTPFAGHNIELYFTYWTDPYTLGLGWYIDDIEIPELGFFDNVEGGADGWTVNAGWYITTGVIPNKFQVNFITTTEMNICHTVTTGYCISHMFLNKAQDGCILLPAYESKFITFGPSVMVAANQPGYEHTFGTYFEFSVDIV